MKRLLLLVLSSLSLVTISQAQIYRLNSTNNGKTYTVCKGMFTSSGFQNTNAPIINDYDIYDNGKTITFCSGGGPLRINFNYINLVSDWDGTDKLEIFDGPSTSSTRIASITGGNGGNNHIDKTSSGTCLTFKFTTYHSVYTNGSNITPWGWQAFLGCMPSGCDGNSPASDICSNAPVICNLDGYCGSTSGWYTADNVSTLENLTNWACSSPWTIQNNSWLAFIANSSSASLSVTATSCSDASNGIQAFILSSNDCNSFSVVSTNCVYNSKSFTLSSNSLVPGKKYYIMIDGATGNDCDYNVIANTGVEYATISPKTKTICEGESVSITVTGGTSYKWYPGGMTGSTINVSPTTSTTYTCEITGKCDLQKLTSTITVKPKPVASATPSSLSICSDGTASITLNSSLSPTTFDWTVSKSGGTVNGSNPGSGSTISQILTSAAGTTTPGIITYNVTPTSNSCKGNVLAVPVTVNPVPVLTTTPSSQTLCSGGTTNIALSSNITANFSWIVSSATGVSGATSGTGTTIAQTLTATGAVAGTVTYEITATSPAPASCAGTKKTVTITVNPRPTITPTVTSQNLCSGGTTSIGLQSDISGTTYSWTTVVTGGVTGAGPGSGSNIIQTLNTSGTTTGTVEYTITATSPAPASCTNAVVTKVLVTVYPIPTISINTPAAICEGQSTSLTATVAPAGGTFLWTPGNLTTQTINITPASTTNYNVQYTLNGCSNSANRNVTVNPLPSVSINTTSSSICAGKTTKLTASSPDAGGTYSWAPGGATTNEITVSPASNTTYTVTYTIGATSCAQTATSTITVKALPTMTVTPTASSICAGASTTLNSNVNPTGGTYSWMPGGKTTSSITETPGASTTYTLTYTAGNGCTQTNSSAAITVKPLDNANFTYPSPTYCTSGGTNPTPTITGLAGGTFSATPAGLSLNASTGVINLGASTVNTYSIKYTTNGVCPNTKSVNLTIVGSANATFTYGAATYCQYGPNPLPNFTPGTSAGTFSANPAGLVFVNTSTGEVDLNASTPGAYTITNSIAAGNGCSATSANFALTITAAPVLSPSTKNQSVCSPGATSITLSGAASYDWTVTSPLTITGASAVTGDVTGNIIQTLTNSDVTPGVVHYVVTPKAGACIGKSDSIHITVNPVPTVSATPVTPSVCSSLITNITLLSNIPTATFAWKVQSSTDASGASDGTGSVIAQALTATTAAPGTVVYRITPSAFGSCDGNYIDVPVVVNPNPTTIITIPSADQTICSGETTNIHLSSSSPLTDFTWTVNQTGVSGASNGTGTDINQVLTALGNTPGKVVYTIIGKGSATGCSGASATDSVMVNPIPTLVVTPLKQEICSGAQTNIALVSNLAGTTFSWTVKPNTVTGASNGSTTVGNIIQTLTNPGSVTDTAVYHIVATAGGCSSTMSPLVDSVEAKIAVNPRPVASAPTPTSICSGDSTNILITCNVANSTFTYKAKTASVDGAGDGAGSLIKQGLSVKFATDSVLYTITPTSEQGCIGSSFTSLVYVNPRPVISFLPSSSQNICSGAQVNVFVVSDVAGTQISWTPRPSIITGTKSGTGPSPAFINDILSISSDTSATVIYDVTASKNGCTNSKLASLLQFTVNPLPKILSSLESASICDGDSIRIALSSNVAGSNFDWAVTQTGVSGAFADSAETVISQALKLTGPTTGTVIYAIASKSPSGCHGASSKSIVITVNPLDNPAFNYSSAKYCQNELDPSAIITGGTAGIFTFLPVGLVLDVNSGKIDLKASSPGDYNIEFKTTGKCSQKGYQNVTINTAPTANTSSVSVGSSSCGTSTGSITGITTASGTAPFKYEWKNSAGIVVDTNLVLTNVPPGSYILKVTDANGCSVTVGSGNSLNVKNEKTVIAAFTSDVTDGQIPLNVQFFNQSTSTGVINYNWNFDNGSTSTLKDPAAVFNEIKVYNVCLYVDDGGKGCKDTLCIPIEASTNSDITIVPNVFTPNGDGVNDILMITATGLGTVNAQIFNRWGQKEYEWNTINGGWDGHTASGVPAVEGTYYIILNATGADKNKTVFPTIKQSFTLLR